MKTCERCDSHFSPKVSYQIYCSKDCRDAATKDKIEERYQLTRRQKRRGKSRKCKSCGTQLSIYNDEPLCVNCNVNPSDVSKALKTIKGIINEIDF